MKKVVIRILAVFFVIASIALICYPFISNYLMERQQESQIVTYNEEVKDVTAERKKAEYEKARQYNLGFSTKVIITDPFDPSFQLPLNIEYDNVLNYTGDGIMGTLEIPVINLELPIYHGTSEEVLLKGVGHLQNTSLPVGGKTSHSILTGHTGLSSAKLFTDLDQIKIGDMFYTNILNDTRAYKVCKIYVIEPDDTESLIVHENKDYISLLTCTPYGVNSHRLVVRGKHIEYNEEEHNKLVDNKPVVDSTWMKEYRRALLIGAEILSGILFVFIVFRIILVLVKKKRSESTDKE